ncbi:MAG: MauE/DoxX family redox-associated membrane protein [Ignavibacteriaceae bacterium]
MIRDNTFNQKSLLTKENIVPKLFSLAYYFIALVLLFSGISKIIDPNNFLKTLNTTLGFFGENIIILIATTMPVIEMSMGLMLMLKIKVKETLVATIILFGSFLLFSVYGTIAIFDIDCGCFGNLIKSQFDFIMVVRNLFFFTVSFVLFFIKRKNYVY